MSERKRREYASGAGRRYDPRRFRRLTRHKKRRFVYAAGRKIVWRRFLPALFCAVLLVFGCVRLTIYLVSARVTRVTNAELQAMYAMPTESPAQETPSPAPTFVKASEPTPRPALLSEYQEIGTSILPELQKLYAKNADLIGWVRIPGVVSLPVVYRDNSYYLTHDFYGKRSDSGALFLDESHPLTARTQYLVIHGHNMYDGSIFGLLGHYRKIDYIREHGIVYYSTLYRQETYVIFASLNVPEDVNAEDYIAYTGTPVFQNEAQFETFVEQVVSLSRYQIPIDVAPSDALLTLSTCLNDNRIILVCRRLRDDETEDDMREILMQSITKTTAAVR